jgi:hypothetical protein
MGTEEPHSETVLSELERILASAEFRGSKRSQEFLRYVVTCALEGKTELLKERIIGVEVFDRPADYETGEDSIVRVKANEVRKRLAQYYQQAGPDSEVQIELPAGSYVPEFRGRSSGPPPRPARLPRRWKPLAAAAAAVLLCCVAAWIWYATRATVFDQFWSPFFRSPHPVLLCVAHPVVYHLRGASRESPQPLVPLADILRDPDHYVGVGDALALAQFHAFFTRAGKPSQLRIGSDTSFADLRNSLAILIGAYTNQWTMQITKDLRFVFDREGSQILIRDQMAQGHRWTYTQTTPPTDFAIVSRIFDSKSGELVIVAAGLSHFGTQVAGEFLTNPAYLEDALRGAPPRWQSLNLQLVLRAEVLGKTPGPPKVLDRHYW